MTARVEIHPSVHASARALAFLLLFALAAAPRPGFADSPILIFTSGFGLQGGYGLDGCAGNNPGPSANQSIPVHAAESVGCFSGHEDISATAGPGFLGASAHALHTGFGTSTGGGIQSEFHGDFTLVSATTESVPVSLNFLIRGEQAGDAGGGGYSVMLLARIQDGPIMFSGSLVNGSAGGSAIPLPDGATHLVTTNTVMLTTNTPYKLGMSLLVSASAFQFGSSASIGFPNSLTFPTSGPVLNLPAGVSVNIPQLNVFDNHWNAPSVGVGGAAALDFGLGALRPNPAPSGRVTVDLALATDSPAALEVFDVAGRRVSAREVGSLGAGRHSVDLADGRALAPGVYLVRLTQGARSAVRHAVVMSR